MNNKRCTIVFFDYGGYYSKEGVYVRWSSVRDEIHSIVMRTVMEEVTYSDLVDKIGKKIGVNEATTQLKLSYFPLVLDPKAPSYISDDEGVFGYLMQMNQDGCRSLIHVELIEDVDRNLIHVELIEDVDRNQGCVQLIGDSIEIEVGGGDDTITDNVYQDEGCVQMTENGLNIEVGGGDGMITDYAGEPSENFEIHEEFRNEEYFGMNEDNEGPSFVDNGWEDGLDIKLDQEFGSRKEVSVLVQKASHDKGFEYKVDKSEPARYVLKCMEAEAGCKWYLRLTKSGGSNNWSVRTYRNMHTCSLATVSTIRNRRKGTPGMVADVLHSKFPGIFNTPAPNLVIPLVLTDAKVEVSYSTALRGKKLAVSQLRGSPEESYQMLPSYLYMLEKMNEGTKTYVEWHNNGMFKYLFFALGACIEGFQAMRKVIIVDGTHLKHAYGGVLIVAMAQDPDRHHYPIAFGVVDGEKDESWIWFMNKLKSVIPDTEGMVFVSDRHKSILKSVREVFPLSIHGFCIFHMSLNVKGNVAGGERKIVANQFIKCAHAYTECEFLQLYGALVERYPTVGQYFLKNKIDLKRWARCYFPGERYNIDTTNCAESINNVFKHARSYTLLPMIDSIVQKLAEWFNKHRKSAAKVRVSQKLVPYVEKLMNKGVSIGKVLPLQELNSFTLEYDVIGQDGIHYLVNLTEKTCSCKCFDIDRYPCVHAIAAIRRLSLQRDVSYHDYCSLYFFMEQWTLAYTRTIYPVPHKSTWMVPAHIRDSGGLPPPHDIKQGRRQERRYPSAGEYRRSGNASGNGNASGSGNAQGDASGSGNRRGNASGSASMYDYPRNDPNVNHPM